MEANIDIERVKEVLHTAARAAGKLLKDSYDKYQRDELKVEHKGTVDLVTEVDKKTEEVIIAIFKKETPNFAILAEESGNHPLEGAAYRWIIDPLDGTTSFAHGHPFFSVSIALEDIRKKQIILGCVYNPTLDELFFAERGKGATRNGIPIHVSKAEKLINSLVASGYPYDRTKWEGKIPSNVPYFNQIIMEVRGFRCNGSAALDLCYVACGRHDAFWEVKLEVWDVAAGLLIVEEAGGVNTDLVGKSLPLTSPIRVISSNGIVHDQICAVFRSVEQKCLFTHN